MFEHRHRDRDSASPCGWTALSTDIPAPSTWWRRCFSSAARIRL